MPATSTVNEESAETRKQTDELVRRMEKGKQWEQKRSTAHP